MDDPTLWLGLCYGTGVLVGLLTLYERWPARAVIAALWPVGPLAFVVVILVLLGVGGIAAVWTSAASLTGTSGKAS